MSAWHSIRTWAGRVLAATFGRGSEGFWRDVGWLPGSGAAVTADTVLGIAGVWKAVNVIGKDIAVLPLDKYRRLDPQGKDRIHDATTRLLNREANLYVKAVDQRLAVQMQALLQGNGYAEIQRDLSMRPLALWWLPSENVSAEVDDAGFLWYVYRHPLREPRRIRPENMLHIRGPAKDGITGWSLVSLARESFCLTMGQEDYAKKQYDNGARPSLIMKTTARLTAEQRKEFRETIEREHAGAERAFRIMILGGDWDASPWSMSNEDAQWLEGRQFQIEEIARWFDLPPHKLGAMGRATWSNVESMQLEYVAGCLQFWLTQWQQECNTKLLTEREKQDDQLFYEFNLDALLRGETITRYQAYAIARANNWLSPNEIRAKENMNLRTDPDGDSYENPNTSSPSAAGETTDRRNVADDGNREPRNQSLHVMATAESQLVLMAAERSKNFCDWVEHTYASGGTWPAHVSEVFVGAGLAAESAEQWCATSKDRLLAVAGQVTQRELRGAVLDLLAEWPLRAEEFCLAGGV